MIHAQCFVADWQYFTEERWQQENAKQIQMTNGPDVLYESMNNWGFGGGGLCFFALCIVYSFSSVVCIYCLMTE